MSEETGQSQVPVSMSVDASSGPSAGDMLRQAREEGGITIAELALALKVPVKKLEALEAGRYELLPDAVFVRALASGVCRALKIDSAPILEHLPQSAAPRLELDGSGLNTPFQTPGDVSGVSMWNQLSRPVVLAALVLLVGALVLIFFPSMDHMLGPLTPSAESGIPTPVPPASEAQTPVAVVPATVTEPVGVPETAAPKMPQSRPAPSVSLAAPVGGVVQVPAAVVSAPLPVPVQGKSTSNGIIVFKTQGPSWIEVIDGSGAVQIRRTISQGEVVGVSGPLPLAVVIGRADLTEVLVRGKPFDLASVAREGVARFEVKQ